MGITVYTKPRCVQCNATYMALGTAGVSKESINSIDLSVNPDKLEDLKALGFMSAPVVTIHDDGGALVDSWAGFRPDKIEEHKAVLALV